MNIPPMPDLIIMGRPTESDWKQIYDLETWGRQGWAEAKSLEGELMLRQDAVSKSQERLCDLVRAEAERDALRAQVKELEAWPFRDGKAWCAASDLREVEAERDAALAQVKELAEALERLSREAPLGDYMQDPADPVNSHFLLEELSHRSDFARAALSHLASADQRTADTSRQ